MNKPKKERIAQIQALKLQGFTYRQIHDITGLAQQTIRNYLLIDDKKVEQIKSIIQTHLLVTDFKLGEKARTGIEEKIDSATPRELISLYKMLRNNASLEEEPKDNSQINIIENKEQRTLMITD